MDLSDDELVGRCKKEFPYETKSFEILISRYQDKVFRKALGFVKNAEEAKDLTQEVFIKVYRGLPSFRGTSTFSTWLYAITVNTCVNHVDKLRRRPWWWLAEDIDEAIEDSVEEEEMFLAIHQTLERAELRQRVGEILGTISEPLRQALLLRYFEELDYAAIAKRLGIRLSATKMRVKRAREEFRQRYTQRYGNVSDD